MATKMEKIELSIDGEYHCPRCNARTGTVYMAPMVHGRNYQWCNACQKAYDF